MANFKTPQIVLQPLDWDRKCYVDFEIVLVAIQIAQRQCIISASLSFLLSNKKPMIYIIKGSLDALSLLF